MNELPLVEAEVTFIPESKGGRHTPPSLVFAGGSYRPHIVVGDPNQRRAVLVGNEIQETYLGILFESGPTSVEFDVSIFAKFYLLYYPQVAYEAVIPGATFTIREGAKIVGFGRVIKLSVPPDA
jgi:hypothetical protein